MTARDARVIELQKLITKHKVLTPELLVKEAEPETSPLHGYFEWDDAKAGYQHRIEQARHLIKIVRLQANDEVGQREIPLIQSVAQGGGKNGYQEIGVIMSDKMQRYARVKAALEHAYGTLANVPDPVTTRCAKFIKGEMMKLHPPKGGRR